MALKRFSVYIYLELRMVFCPGGLSPEGHILILYYIVLYVLYQTVAGSSPVGGNLLIKKISTQEKVDGGSYTRKVAESLFIEATCPRAAWLSNFCFQRR
jgi:hypothetical protein